MNELKALNEAILSTYTQAEFARLLKFELGWELMHIADGAADFREVVFSVVQYADRQGKLTQLKEVLRRDRPNNPAFKTLVMNEMFPHSIGRMVAGGTLLIIVLLAISLFSVNRQSIEIGGDADNSIIIQERGDGDVHIIHPTNTPLPPPTPTPTLFPSAKDGETLVLVADFVDPEGIDSQLFTQNLVTDLREALEDHDDIRIEYLQSVITAPEGSERAMEIAKDPAFNADIIIWGNYAPSPQLKEPQVHIHFDIVQEPDTYLDDGFYERHHGAQLLEPSMFDFQMAMGQYLGEMVTFMAGLILFEARSFNDAEEYFNTTVQAIDTTLANQFVFAIHFYRGTNYLYLGQVKKALLDLSLLEASISDQVTAIHNQDETSVIEDDLLFYALNNIGSVYDALGDIENALKWYEDTLSIQYYWSDPEKETTVLNNLGGSYFTLGRWGKALELYEQALIISRKTNNQGAEAATLNNMGITYSALGEKEKALKLYEQALLISQYMG